MTEEQKVREFTRVPIRTWVALTPDDQKPILCDSCNVSMNGILVTTRCEVPLDTECFVTMILGHGSETLTISARGKSVRRSGGEVGIHFLEIELGSFEHLRRLVALNATDADTIEGELEKVERLPACG